MTLKALVSVFPGYTKVYVHDKGDGFACKGNPYQFITGDFSSHRNDNVCRVSAIDSYEIEVTVEEENT